MMAIMTDDEAHDIVRVRVGDDGKAVISQDVMADNMRKLGFEPKFINDMKKKLREAVRDAGL